MGAKYAEQVNDDDDDDDGVALAQSLLRRVGSLLRSLTQSITRSAVAVHMHDYYER